ncbi:F-box/WD repeat-containing protein 11 [Amanita rubescens]|nr:F-box/WD repeat-containing protein 11 [Amanita rubescens]
MPFNTNSYELAGISGLSNPKECEELVYRLLAALPRSHLASIQRHIAPLLPFDILSSLPTELALHVLAFLSYRSIQTCSLVCRRWRTLTEDQELWKRLCRVRGWEWRDPRPLLGHTSGDYTAEPWDDTEDEGMGDLDHEGPGIDSGIASESMVIGEPSFPVTMSASNNIHHSSPGVHQQCSWPFISNPNSSANYKILFLTNRLLHTRFLRGSYRLSHLQTRQTPGHGTMIYCLQLYTYPITGRQTLFTSSRDKTVKEWDLESRKASRVFSGIHTGSVLSICVHSGFLASAGTDGMVVVWDLNSDKLVKVISDHADSVLCVRFDSERMVTCSKDQTMRTYSFPDLVPQFVLSEHRAAVNAVSIYKNLIVSGSGDRSVKLWDLETGKLLRTYEDHHSRGIASIDFKPPFILTGSSDRQLRLFDMTTLKGWSTTQEGTLLETSGAQTAAAGFSTTSSSGPNNAPYQFDPEFLSGAFSTADTVRIVCRACGSNDIGALHAHNGPSSQARSAKHVDLVRSVVLGEKFVVSGSYDKTIKIWDRRSGTLVADLTGGHTGRILCIAFDKTKVVSCGEDYSMEWSLQILVSFVQDIYIIQDQLRSSFVSTHYSQHHRGLPKMAVLD